MAYDTGTNLGIYDSWLKDFYLSNWIDMLNQSTTTWNMFRQDVVSYHGKRMVIPLRIGRNASPTFIARSTSATGSPVTLSTPGWQEVDTAFPYPRLFTGSIMLTQDAIDQARTDRGTFMDIIDTEMMGLLRDSKEFLDKNCYSDGSGHNPYFMKYDASTQLGSVLAVSTTNLVVVGPHLYYPGKRIQVFSSGYESHLTNSGSFSGYAVVMSKTNNGDGTATITLKADDNWKNGSPVNLANENTSGGYSDWVKGLHIHDYGSLNWTDVDNYYGQGFRGLPAMVASYDPLGNGLSGDDAGYLGKTRSTRDWWQAKIDTTDGNSANDYQWTSSANGDPANVLQKMIDEIHDDSQGEIDTVIMSRMGSRVMMHLMAGGKNPPQSKQRFVNTIKTKAGFFDKKQDKHPGSKDWVMFNDDIPVIVDKYARPYAVDVSGTNDSLYQPIWCIDSSTIYLGVVTDFSWWDVGGIFDRVPGASGGNYKFAVVANLYMLADFVCDAPNRNGLITRVKVGTHGQTG